MIRETAYYEEADSTETLDLYEVLLDDGVSIDVVFERDASREKAPLAQREKEARG